MPTPPTTYAGYDQPILASAYGQSSSTSAAAPSYAATHESFPQHTSTHWGNGRSPPVTSYSSTPSQAPYPTSSHIPVGPNYSDRDPHSFLNLASDSNSTPSPVPSPRTSPALARHPTNAPLPSRPVEDPSFESYRPNGTIRTDLAQEHLTQDDIIQDIEAELGGVRGSHRDQPAPYDQRNGRYTDDDDQNLRRLISNASYRSTATTAYASDESGVNRYSSNASTVNRNNLRNSNISEEEGDESDPEGAAGALALLQAEADDHRFSSFPLFSQPEVAVQPTLPTHKEEPSSDSDYAGMDLGLAGGGYGGQLTYGNNLGSHPGPETSQSVTQAIHRNHASQRSHDSTKYPAFTQADLDYGGCGGLQSPRAHRLSFDDGEERVSLHSRQSGSESPVKDDYPDMFYHPGIGNRPLPALPPGSDSSSLLSIQSPNRSGLQHNHSLSAESRSYSGPDAYYGQNAQQLQVERSISLSSHSTSPHVQPPGRSKTDAAEERNARMKHMRQQHPLTAQQGLPYEGYGAGTPSSVNYDVITLPSGRRRKFQPEKLTLVDVQSCTEPWALSGISKWIREMADGEPDLKRKTVEDGLVRLFCLKVPTMNVADAETLSAQVMESILQAGILVPEEEWLKFGHGSISGVLWQLTGVGCYAPKLHENQGLMGSQEVTGRCYSFHCMRTLKKANLDELMLDGTKTLDWATFYNLTKESVEDKSKYEIKRQNVLHECITSEQLYMNQLEVLRLLYRDRLITTQPRIIAESRMDKFVSAVFGKAEAVQRVNKDHLLAQMKYRQKEQGPWLTGLSDIFREWVRKARTAYIDYAASFPYAWFLIRRESDRNVVFRQFLETVRNDPRSMRLGYDTYIKSPIARLQRYPLLLDSVVKEMRQDSEEKTNILKAIEEIKAVAHECDAKVAEMERKVLMMELDQMLVMRPGLHADLHLDHLGRELILEGDLQRMGSKGVRWVDTHGLLFDHYLILAKLVISRDVGREKKYDVSKEVSCT